jgi:flagellar protein FliS
MTKSQALRERFTTGGLDTASAPKIVVMAYDRLDRDIAGALSALTDGNLAEAHQLLCHAQELVHELNGMLDVDAWEHGPALAAIYRYVIVRLTEANMTKRAAPATEARNLLAELGDSFRQAAVSTSTGPTIAAPPSLPSTLAESPAGRLSLRA